MVNWLERAKSEILKSAYRGTANTAERGVSSVTAVGHPGKSEKILSAESTTLQQPTKPGFGSFVSTGTLVSEALRIFGGRILDPNEVDDDVQEKPKAVCIRCRGTIVQRVWPNRVDRGCHACGRTSK